MWSEPVTLGGGMTMVNGSASGRSGRNRPSASQRAYQRDSISAGSKVLASSVIWEALAETNPSCQRRLASQRVKGAGGLHPPGPQPPPGRRLEAFAGNPCDLAGDQLLDHVGEVAVEPVLEQRLQHLAH